MTRTLLLLAVFALACLGCPGEIDDPAAFLAQGLDGGGGTSCDAVNNVFVPVCGSCHHAPPNQLGNLDLTSPDVASRLVGVQSANCEPTDILVVPGQPDASYLYQKITLAQPQCGGPMPQVGSLTQEQISCVASWIDGLGVDGGN